MNRRAFISLLGGAAATWPLASRAQQPMPVIGFLHGGDSEQFDHLLVALRRGLAETGYEEGRNIAIEYRWAESRYDRLPAFAAELVARKVALFITAGGDASASAAKAATTTTPIVFISGGDPVRSGLVASLNQPGGNLTGITVFTSALEPKRLELLREVAPGAGTMGALLNPTRADAESQVREVQDAARALGQRVIILNASTDDEIGHAFASLAQQRIGALLVGSDVFFYRRREKLVALAASYAVPAIYQWREFAAAGGLMSYGTNIADGYRQVGIYAGRILKGAKPADLPVQQSTKVELAINLKAAKALGIEVPMPLLMRVDEVIE
jgi:putative ABC transport system substrate-binding protein